MRGEFLSVLTILNKWASLVLPILTLLGLIIPKIRKWLKSKLQTFLGLDEIHKDIKNGFNKMDKLENQIEELKKSFNQHLDQDSEKIKAQLANLRDSLMRAFNFYISRGYITLEELTSLQEVYKSYRYFNGNGLFKKKWEEEILKLPNQPPNK